MATDFKNMSTDEALDYCYKHSDEYKAGLYLCGENGERSFDCLIAIVEDGTIEPSELPDYGMEFDDE